MPDAPTDLDFDLCTHAFAANIWRLESRKGHARDPHEGREQSAGMPHAPNAAFAPPTGGAGLLRGVGGRSALCGPRRARPSARSRARPCMQLPPGPRKWPEPPLTDLQRGPVGYEWDPDYPGTLKPGLMQDDCYPLDGVLESGVYENMVYQELEMHEIVDNVHTPDKDLLEWLAKQGRLLNDSGELEDEADKQIVGVTEEDLDFSEEDDKMLAFYSKQGEGSSVGSGADFGGLAESSLEGGFE